MAINRLIASAGNTPNFAQSGISGFRAGQQARAADLQNVAAQNELNKQANVNRLLQEQAQTLLTPQVQAGSLATGAIQAPADTQNPFTSLLTQQDKQRAQLLVANQDVKGLMDLQKEVLVRGQKQAKTQREIKGKTFEQESKLRKEFDTASKDFIKVRDAHTRVITAADDPSPAGDLALIFNYMKVLDPGSTVREGEFATAQNSGGVDDRARALYNQVVNGTRLSPSQRADFVNRSGRLFEGQLQNQQASEERFRGLAKRAEVDPQNVVFEFRLPDGSTTQTTIDEMTEDDFRQMSAEDLEAFIQEAEKQGL